MEGDLVVKPIADFEFFTGLDSDWLLVLPRRPAAGMCVCVCVNKIILGCKHTIRRKKEKKMVSYRSATT